MKKLSVLTYIFIITGFINAATNLPNVSVLKFKGKGVSENDAEGISDLFAVALVNSQKYSVLNRENMQDILAEQSFQASGCTDEACAVQIGRLLNMDYMFTGSAIKIASKFYITVNMVSINSGRIVRSAKSPGIQLENVEAGLRELLIRFHTGKETARAAADSPKPDGASPNRLKPFLGVSTLTLTAASSIMLISGLVNAGKADSAETAYMEADSDFDSLFSDWQDAAGKRDTFNTLALSGGCGAAVMALLYFILPSGERKQAFLTPQLNPQKIYLTACFNF